MAAATTLTLAAVGALGGTAFAGNDKTHDNGHASSTSTSTSTSTSHGKANGGSSHGKAKGGSAHEVKTSPQPPSNADFSGHGANQHGPYDSTRDGSPSANGNGGGKASGRPCAGCVGKADNKNPKGQLPGPQDNNAGYECDRNSGIGRGNPAHTGCTTSTDQPSDGSGSGTGPAVGGTTDTGSTGTGTGTTGSGSTGTGGSGGSIGAGGTTPAAHTCPNAATMVGAVADEKNCTAVLGTSVQRAAAARAVTPSVLAAGAALPFTGAPVGLLALVAAAMLAVGAGLMFGSRRRGGVRAV